MEKKDFGRDYEEFVKWRKQSSQNRKFQIQVKEILRRNMRIMQHTIKETQRNKLHKTSYSLFEHVGKLVCDEDYF